MVASFYIDETFDINNCQNYILSIQCALDGFSFSIYDIAVNKFIVLAEYPIVAATPYQLKNELNDLIKEEPIIQQKYKQVNCAYLTHKITIAPKSLVTGDDYRALFNLTFENNREEEIIIDGTHPDLKLLSAIPYNIKQLFFESFSNCNFFTPLSSVITYSRHHQSAHQQIYAVKYSHTLLTMVITNRNIEFVNSFFVKNDTDCLYYLLNVAKQLQATSKTELNLLGNITPKSSLIDSLKNYFTKVHTAHYSSRYAVSYTFLKEPENYYLPLIELALCE